MAQFYHEEKKKTGSENLPDILGLSASPVRRSKIEEIQYVPNASNGILLILLSVKSSATLMQSV
jgi:hypothetical protein